MTRTERQQEALEAWARTPTSKEVGWALGISPAAAWALLDRARLGDRRWRRPMTKADLHALFERDGLHLHLTGWAEGQRARWVVAVSYTHVCETERCYRNTTLAKLELDERGRDTV